ncbi:beta-propeller fold lactonase family protein [candidate division KSB1 bacterium]|nr:beta-propeller fold lactonase family protein [candidate division KSB1 bacterium]
MRSLVLQIPMSRCSRQSWRQAPAAMLIWAMLGCTGHDNPFDSENSKKHDPFEFDAVTDYGKITLKWKWPTYPVESDQRIDVDRFVLFRQALNSTKIDTIYPAPPRREVWIDSTTTTGIVGDKLYTYRVTAMRDNSWSDLSWPDSALAYPLPLDCNYLGETNINAPVSFSLPTAIGFCGKTKFVAAGGFLRVFNANDEEIDFHRIYNPTSDMAVVCTAPNDSAYIYVCSSALFGRVQVFLWTGSFLIAACETDAIAKPQAVVADPSRDAVYIADGNSQAIFKFRVGKCDPARTNMRTGLNPRRLAVLPDARRLFCANEGSNSISIFNISTESRLQEIQLNDRPKDLWVGHDSKLYVTTAKGTIVIIDPLSYGTIEISVGIPGMESPLSPRSVTGFVDPQNRHPGVLAVAACTGDPGDNPAFLLYYSFADWKLQRYLELPFVDSPRDASFLARMNAQEGRIYMLLTDRIRVCKFN